MSGFDADRVFSVSVHDVPSAFAADSPSELEKLLLDFLLQYRLGGEFVYRYAPMIHPKLTGSHLFLSLRDKLRANLLLKHYQLEVDLRHIGLYNDELAHTIQDRPADVLPLVSMRSSTLRNYSHHVGSLKMLPQRHRVLSSFHWLAVTKSVQSPPRRLYPKSKSPLSPGSTCCNSANSLPTR